MCLFLTCQKTPEVSFFFCVESNIVTWKHILYLSWDRIHTVRWLLDKRGLTLAQLHPRPPVLSWPCVFTVRGGVADASVGQCSFTQASHQLSPPAHRWMEPVTRPAPSGFNGQQRKTNGERTGGWRAAVEGKKDGGRGEETRSVGGKNEIQKQFRKSWGVGIRAHMCRRH